MVNRSADKTVSARVPSSEYVAAVSNVPPGWTLPVLIRALVRAVADAATRPKLLRILEPHRPSPGPVGRPPKRTDDPH